MKVLYKWIGSFPTWYSKLEVCLKNDSENEYINPTVEFDISGINYNKYIDTISADTGFESDSVKLPKISGKLNNEFSILKPKTSVKLNFGINFASETFFSHFPINLKFNGQLIEIDNSDPDTPDIPDIPDIPDPDIPDIPDIPDPDIPDPDIPDTEDKFIILPKWKDFKSVPFVDATSFPIPKFHDWFKYTNSNGMFIGFIVGHVNGNTVTGNFGGFSKIYNNNDGVSYSGNAMESDFMKDDIKKIREENGDVVFSFGGASGSPIEELIQDTDELLNIYKGIIDNYKLKYIDFDFEGSFLGNTSALDRHVIVIKKLVKLYPKLKVSYTLPVDGAKTLMGLNFHGEVFLRKLYNAKILPSMINVMAMEFGETIQPEFYKSIADSIKGIENGETYQRGLVRQINEIYKFLTPSEIYKLIGICPMYGKNNNSKIYSLEDQENLDIFIKDNNIPLFSGWDLSRDMTPGKTGLDIPIGSFLKLVNQ